MMFHPQELFTNEEEEWVCEPCLLWEEEYNRLTQEELDELHARPNPWLL